jgi:hypothetical protein
VVEKCPLGLCRPEEDVRISPRHWPTQLRRDAICQADLLEGLPEPRAEGGIKHGIFGGYAIGSLSGPRESKDIDCIASINKDQLISILHGKNGFQAIPRSRDDRVTFFW